MKAQKLMTPLAFVALMGSLSASVNAAPITANLLDGSFNARVTIEDTTTTTDSDDGLGRLSFVLDVATPNTGLTSGDILGIWLDIKEDQLPSPSDTLFQNAFQYNITVTNNVPTYSPVNYSIAQSIFSANGVGAKPFSGHPNININGLSGGYDIGIRVGAHGDSEGKNPKVSFDMVFAGLSLDLFANQRVALRVQSITMPGINDGSAKLTGKFNSPLPPGGGEPPNPNPIPEPSSILLLLVGLLGGVFSLRPWRMRRVA